MVGSPDARGNVTQCRPDVDRWNLVRRDRTDRRAQPGNRRTDRHRRRGGPVEATAAVEAADRAQRSWAATAPRVRAEILRSCWSTLIEHTDELATLITLEHGKPLADAKGEIAYAAEFFRWNSEEAVRIDGMIKTAPGGSSKIIVHHPPVGVVVMVTPWNFPAAMITQGRSALAAGNACVIKPPAETPLTALRVAQLLEEAVSRPVSSTSSHKHPR